MTLVDDQRALEDLHNRYVHAIDRGDLELLRSLYTHDATEQHGDYSGPVDGFIEWLEPVLDFFVIATHTISNLLCRVDGERAESEARGTAFLRMKGDPPFSMIVVNRHFDHYRKVGGQWLFSSRCVCVDWAEQFPARKGELDMVRPFPAGTTSKDDPVYAQVPGLVSALRSNLAAGA